MKICNNITIAIPVFERYDFFEQAYNSAINQTVICPVIVIDNASSHNMFENYVSSNKHKLVKYIKNINNVGAIANWNKCLEMAETKWVTILHSDDILSLKYIEIMQDVIEINKNDAAILINEDIGAKPRLDIFQNITVKYTTPLKPLHFLFGNHAGFPGNIINKEKINNITFREELSGASDYTFWYELSLIAPLKKIKNKLAFYRISNVQDTAVMNLYDVVIDKVFFVRKNMIRFPNKFIEVASMCELYKLYCDFIKRYNRKDVSFNSGYEEVNIYFRFFAKPINKISINIFFRVLSKIIRSF